MRELVSCLVRQQRIEQELAKKASSKKKSQKTNALVDTILETEKLQFSSDEEVKKETTMVKQIL
jgi:hypothetical protein